MNKKMVAVAIAALMTVPAMAAASQFTAEGSEQIVEGHTVFTVLEKKVNVENAGWDIAGLVRERNVQFGPNVAWFNDQWKTFFYADDVRYPCGGLVIATWSGIDPLWLLSDFTLSGQAAVFENPNPANRITYRESYYITDPNGFISETHLYTVVNVPLGVRGIPVWVTTVQGINGNTIDDGVSSCDPVQDLATVNTADESPYNDGGDNIPIRIYNFDLFGLWKDVLADSVKTHGSLPDLLTKEHGETPSQPLTDQSEPNDAEITGCESGTEWECGVDANGNPRSDDDEGYSHPYNMYYADSGQVHTHETGRLDMIFVSNITSWATFASDFASVYPPAVPNYVVYDTEIVESEVHPCNDPTGDGIPDGFVNLTIAASCFPRGSGSWPSGLG